MAEVLILDTFDAEKGPRKVELKSLPRKTLVKLARDGNAEALQLLARDRA